MAMVAVLTFPVKGKNDHIYTCNMVESMDVTLKRIQWRFDDLLKKGFEPTGDIILNFVKTDD